jgi:hypothetical protein
MPDAIWLTAVLAVVQNLVALERTFPCNLEPVPDVEAGQFESNRATFCSVSKFLIGAGLLKQAAVAK